MKLPAICSALLFTLTSVLSQATPLSDLVEKYEMTWLIAKWVDGDTKGQVASLGFEWRLDKHAIAVTMKSPDRNAEAMAAVKPGTDKVVQMGIDNQGNAAKGEWTLHEGKPLLKATYSTPDGDEGTMGVMIEKKSDTLLVAHIVKLDEDDRPTGDPKFSMTLVKADK
jgi:hypothetical protein